jgi:DUF4097 and DUF4098 domain-containing protein YvlB
MLTTVMLVGLAALPGAQQIDTILPAPSGTELRVNLMQGDVTVRGWDRREVRVQSAGGGLDVRATNGTIKVGTDVLRGGGQPQSVTLSVPRDMAVELSGPTLTADLADLDGEVSVSTTHGGIRLEGGSAYIRLHSLQGDVEVRGARGRIDAETNQGDVSVTSSSGPIRAHSLNGTVTLEGVTSDAVDAYSLNGDIVYAGSLETGGTYSLSTHAGDVVVKVPADASVAISASTFGGAFESAFPVTLRKAESGGRTVTLSLGTGGARMELQSFGGTIRLERP